MTTQAKANQQLLLEKFESFLGNTLKDDPSLTAYLKEWNTLKDLMQYRPIQFDKITKHISQINTLSSSYQAKPSENNQPTQTKVESIFATTRTTSSVINSGICESNSKVILNAKSFATLSESFSRSPNVNNQNLKELDSRKNMQSKGSYLEPEQKSLVLTNLYKLREKFKNNTEVLAKDIQKQNALASKTEDMLFLQGCSRQSKDENNVVEIMRELDNKLAAIGIADRNSNSYSQ